MTSKPLELYIGLAHEAAQAAQPVALLKLSRRGTVESGEFAYGHSYLQRPDAYALNPDHLPLSNAVLALPERRLRDGGALPLTLRDALPDSWGRKVLEVQQQRPVPDTEALLLTNEDRVGAMVFSAQLPFAAEAGTSVLPTLDDLADAARQVELGQETSPLWRRLLQGGASLGGARPKATFMHNGQRHMAKFAQQGDDTDMALLEGACLQLAHLCGIDTPPHQVHTLRQGHALLVQRFDRIGPTSAERRVHYLSASALLDVPYETSDGSYVALAQALRRLSARPQRDLHELYRRLLFNLVVGNSDDHVKNHGVLHAGPGRVQLAPAFDLVPQLDGHVGYQALAILPGRHESSLDLAFQAAPHFGVAHAAAQDMLAHTMAVVSAHAAAVLAALGGDAMLVQRMTRFLAQQARRVA